MWERGWQASGVDSVAFPAGIRDPAEVAPVEAASEAGLVAEALVVADPVEAGS